MHTDTSTRIITATAPIRIADVGGWTDTWFAGHGRVCNIAVHPYVEVQCTVSPRTDSHPRIQVHAENFGLRFSIDDLKQAYDKLPLLECALRRMQIPDHVRLHVNLHCEVPPGASTGTSAAVSVAIIAALDRLTPGRLTPYEIARLAHRMEAEDLCLQSGIQDQLCAAYGGINLIEMHAYPHASVSPIIMSDSTRWELERRLCLIYVGRPHQSSAVHKEVINGLGPRASDDPRLEKLRLLAGDAKDALASGDWERLGATWNANTNVQRELHSSLVSKQAEQIIAIASAHGTLGCKVNGAGGDGGSISILGAARSDAARALLREIANVGGIPIPLTLAPSGLRVWEFYG